MMYKGNKAEKRIMWARNKKKELSKQYNIDESKIVWVGEDSFVLCYSPTNQVRI